MNFQLSEEAYKESSRLMPGGVNSPVRSFKSIGISPLFIKNASGSNLTDIDGNTFIDYCLSWGVGILGHAHPKIEKPLIWLLKMAQAMAPPLYSKPNWHR
jgi:glutamate-1-semialdehyde 2,1-aminomutase